MSNEINKNYFDIYKIIITKYEIKERQTNKHTLNYRAQTDSYQNRGWDELNG